MTVVIKHKQSSTANSAPSYNDLADGELAINTNDGKLFFRRDDGAAQTIVSIKEDTEYNFNIDSTLLDHSSSTSLSGVLHDFDDAINDNLFDLDDVNYTTANLSSGDILQWSGTEWAAVNGSNLQLSSITISLIDANNAYSNSTSNVTGIRFDEDSGFDVTDLGSGNVKIAMNSTFKTWKVSGQSDLVASGLDTIELKAGNGITLTTNPTDTPYKSLTIESDPNQLIGVILDMTIDAQGYLQLTHVDTFDTNSAFIDPTGYFILTDGT